MNTKEEMQKDLPKADAEICKDAELNQKKYLKNQKRLRKILDLVPHMIFLKDKTGKILMANQACADFYNTTAKKLVYSNIKDYHPDETELTAILKADKEVIEKKQSIEIDELILTDYLGQKRIFKSTKIPFTDPLNHETGALGISIDITEQKQIEAQRREMQEKYRLIVERGNDGIIILQNDIIVYSNKQAAKIFGQKMQDFIHKNIADFIGQSELNRLTQTYFKSRTNKEDDLPLETGFVKPDGNICYIELKISTFSLKSEKSRFIFIRDITRRKLIEQLHQRDRHILEQAQKIAKLGSWELNLKNKEFYCSDEVYRILEVQNHTKSVKVNWLINFVPKEERKALFKAFLHAYRNNVQCEHQFPIVTAKGKEKIIQAHSQVYSTDKGGKYFIGTWLDITERIRAERQLKEAKKRAEESDRLKSAFLANMSHEIRTPMNAIIGFANLLKIPDLDEQNKFEYLNHIIQSGDNLLNLINDIIDVSKIEAEQLKIEKSPVNINELLNQLHSRYEELLTLKQPGEIKLYLEKALPGEGISIESDPYRLQQVISNLLNNAIKFTKSGRIDFGYTLENSHVKFFVRDTGLGVPKDKEQFIFTRFGKLEDPEKFNQSGTGLGLSISKSLIQLLGGNMWLNTDYKNGAEFFFTIPLREIKQNKTSDKNSNSPKPDENLKINGKTILIAEDEVLNYKLLETLVKRTGAEVVWAKDGLQALDIVKDRNDIDLVFMDIKMPKMNGYEATKKIKQIKPNLPVIAQTAFAFADEKKRIIQSGCDRFLKKPLKKQEIYKALSDFLK
ncbi:MAG: PAS domain S-box protein [Bacteroidales bacterium]|nr:PAS domain S-box protein [Bacteroidales bacterium]